MNDSNRLLKLVWRVHIRICKYIHDATKDIEYLERLHNRATKFDTCLTMLLYKEMPQKPGLLPLNKEEWEGFIESYETYIGLENTDTKIIKRQQLEIGEDIIWWCIINVCDFTLQNVYSKNYGSLKPATTGNNNLYWKLMQLTSHSIVILIIMYYCITKISKTSRHRNIANGQIAILKKQNYTDSWSKLL